MRRRSRRSNRRHRAARAATGVRIFTGTIPDYASDAKGLLLGGVVGGGPAEQAGLQKGDVIVEIAGQTITNIYDYTYALDVLKIGQPAKVVYTRNGERKETTLTPVRSKVGQPFQGRRCEAICPPGLPAPPGPPDLPALTLAICRT